MTWAESFSIVGGAFALAFMFIGLSGSLPDIHIHRHYHNRKRK